MNAPSTLRMNCLLSFIIRPSNSPLPAIYREPRKFTWPAQSERPVFRAARGGAEIRLFTRQWLLCFQANSDISFILEGLSSDLSALGRRRRANTFRSILIATSIARGRVSGVFHPNQPFLFRLRLRAGRGACNFSPLLLRDEGGTRRAFTEHPRPCRAGHTGRRNAPSPCCHRMHAPRAHRRPFRRILDSRSSCRIRWTNSRPPSRTLQGRTYTPSAFPWPALGDSIIPSITACLNATSKPPWCAACRVQPSCWIGRRSTKRWLPRHVVPGTCHQRRRDRTRYDPRGAGPRILSCDRRRRKRSRRLIAGIWSDLARESFDRVHVADEPPASVKATMTERRPGKTSREGCEHARGGRGNHDARERPIPSC